VPCPYFAHTSSIIERPSVSVRPSPSSHPASRWACGHAECRCLAPFLAMQVTCFLPWQWDMQKIPMQIVPVKLLWRFPSLYMLVHSWKWPLIFTHKRLVQLEQLGFSRRWTKLLAKLAREEIPDAGFRYTFATLLRDLNGSISSWKLWSTESPVP